MFTSIRSKLFTIFLLVSLVPLLCVSIFFYTEMQSGFSRLLTENKNETKATVSLQLNQAATDLLTLTSLYANDVELKEAFLNHDREQLHLSMQHMYTRLQAEHGIDVFEFGDSAGNVFYRAHNPEKFGDDKSGMAVIQSALNGEELAGFEFGNSGLAVRAFVPIKVDNETIGTLQTGLSSTFLNSITDSLQRVDLNIFNTDGEIMVSSHDDVIDSRLNEPLIEKVMRGEEVTEDRGNLRETYIPLFDPTQSEVIGIINFNQDESIIGQFQNRIVLILFIVLGITVLAISFIAWAISRSFSKPIQDVTEVMDEIAKGNLTAALTTKSRKDEIGKLFKSVNETKTHLREIIQTLAHLTGRVNQQSAMLRQSSEEIMNGSQQISMTMQELSNGAESQASATVDLTETMQSYSAKITSASKTGDDLASTASNVLKLTEAGKERMDTSITQMDTIHQRVDEAVTKVVSLEQKSSDITNLVNMIQAVAEQTNLLALNAAIEAARAGEHGRGFAVVADEVRKLAEQAAHSTEDIKAIVSGIQTESRQATDALRSSYSQVELGTKQIDATGQTLNEMTAAIAEMITKINQNTSDLKMIEQDSEDMQQFIDHIASISEESAAGIEQTTASTQQTASSIEQIAQNTDTLDQLVQELNEKMKRFKI
ncbi:methyl-accepting chemotaxis protein [Halalkalibacter oceani]|uniref:methyl-accepting chemotaxis protein n=1 Tax=Halalkalibacter oceani TaxID=1653776 RepID=UPI0033984C61